MMTMIKSIIGGVLVLVGLLVQTAPTMIKYSNRKKSELDLIWDREPLTTRGSISRYPSKQ